jgi:hypothetical protein
VVALTFTILGAFLRSTRAEPVRRHGLTAALGHGPRRRSPATRVSGRGRPGGGRAAGRR